MKTPHTIVNRVVSGTTPYIHTYIHLGYTSRAKRGLVGRGSVIMRVNGQNHQTWILHEID